MASLKQNVKTVKKGGLTYLVGSDNRLQRFKPWLGDNVSFFYDWLMAHSLFPNKFGSSLDEHNAILKETLAEVHGLEVLELGTGSGSAVEFLPNDNGYTGSDISTGLLKRAVKRFARAGFGAPTFHVASADDLPFTGGVFDLCLCVLTLNFVPNPAAALDEVWRVLAPGGVFVGCVTVPERNALNSTIRGTLHSAAELMALFRAHGFAFEALPHENGALLYWKAVRQG